MKLRTLLILMCLAISAIPISIIMGIQGVRASFYMIGLIFFVTLIASLVIAYFISRPLEKLNNNILKISKGELDVQLGLSEIYEINTLTESLNRVMASLKLAVHKVGVKKGEIFEDAIRAKEIFEKKQKHLFDSINGWAWETDENLSYTFLSENVKSILGYENDDLINQNLFELMDINDAKKIKKVFEASNKEKLPIKNLENYYLNKEGDKIPIIINAFPYYDNTGKFLGYRGVMTDNSKIEKYQNKIKNLNKEISELKQEISVLLNKNSKNKKINPKDTNTEINKTNWTEHEFDSFFIFDSDANILDCNEKMVKKLGYSKSEFLSFNISDFDVLETKEDILKKINEVKKNGNISFKTIHKRKDGSAVLVFENMQYLKDKDEFRCVVREDYTIKKNS